MFGFSLLANLAATLLPGWYERVSARRFERKMEAVSRKVSRLARGVVMGGPFAGMRYVDQARGSALCPKLIGCYEAELHPILDRIFDNPYSCIIDVGAAEGYYAIGLALRFPRVAVVAFDADPDARMLCGKMASMNGVQERLTILGACRPDLLESVLHPRTLVVCDCEGFEDQLLKTDDVPGLMKCDLLIETHDHLCPGISDRLLRRFAATHDIQWIEVRQRVVRDLPLLNSLTVCEKRLAMHEFRPTMQQWAWMIMKEVKR